MAWGKCVPKLLRFIHAFPGLLLRMYLVGMLLSNPKIKAKMGNAMNEGMLAPYQKILGEKKSSKK